MFTKLLVLLTSLLQLEVSCGQHLGGRSHDIRNFNNHSIDKKIKHKDCNCISSIYNNLNMPYTGNSISNFNSQVKKNKLNQINKEIRVSPTLHLLEHTNFQQTGNPEQPFNTFAPQPNLRQPDYTKHTDLLKNTLFPLHTSHQTKPAKIQHLRSLPIQANHQINLPFNQQHPTDQQELKSSKQPIFEETISQQLSNSQQPTNLPQYTYKCLQQSLQNPSVNLNNLPSPNQHQSTYTCATPVISFPFNNGHNSHSSESYLNSETNQLIPPQFSNTYIISDDSIEKNLASIPVVSKSVVNDELQFKLTSPQPEPNPVSTQSNSLSPSLNQQVFTSMQNSLKDSQNPTTNVQYMLIEPILPASSQSVSTTGQNNSPSLVSPINSNYPYLTQNYVSSYTNNPIQFQQSGRSSRRSRLKKLLPIILSLMNEKNTGCGCCPNCKCGCMNNNNINKPEVFSNYSNQANYSYISEAPVETARDEEFDSNESEHEITITKTEPIESTETYDEIKIEFDTEYD